MVSHPKRNNQGADEQPTSSPSVRNLTQLFESNSSINSTISSPANSFIHRYHYHGLSSSKNTHSNASSGGFKTDPIHQHQVRTNEISVCFKLNKQQHHIDEFEEEDNDNQPKPLPKTHLHSPLSSAKLSLKFNDDFDKQHDDPNERHVLSKSRESKNYTLHSSTKASESRDSISNGQSGHDAQTNVVNYAEEEKGKNRIKDSNYDEVDDAKNLKLHNGTNLVLKENPIQKEDDIILSRRKMLIVGLKEHLNSSASFIKANLRNDCEEEKETACNSIHVQTGTPWKDSFIIEKGHFEQNESLSDVIVNKNESTTSNRCTSKVIEVVSDQYTNDLNINISEQQHSSTSIDRSKSEDEFTISRASIDQIPTPPDKIDAQAENGHTHNYLSALIRHCQSKLTPRRPRRVAADFVDDHSETRDEEVLPPPLDSNSKQARSRKYDMNVIVSRIRGRTCRTFEHVSAKISMRRVEQIEQLFMNCLQRCNMNMKAALKYLAYTHVVTKLVVKSAMNTSTDMLLSVMSLLVTIAVSLYPTIPRSNCGIASFVLLLTANKQNYDHRKRFHLAVLLLVLVTVIIDIDWLISDYFPKSLDSTMDESVFGLEQGESLTKNFIRYITMVGIPFKLIPVFLMIKGSSNGKRLIHQLWRRTYAFFPPLPSSLSSPKKEYGLEILQFRVIAIIWLEVFCAVMIVSLAIYAQVHLSWSPIFTAATNTFTPLINILFCKGISGILYVMGLLRNVNVMSVLSELGCLNFKFNDHQGDDAHEDTNDLEEEQHVVKVLIDRSFLKFNGFLKIVDVIVSIIAWTSVFQARQLGGLDQPKEIRLVLGFVVLSLVLSTLYGMFLASAVACYANSLLQFNESDVNNSFEQQRSISSERSTPDSFRHNNHLHQQRESISRIHRRSPTTQYHEIELDSNVQCTPRQFEEQWKLLLSSSDNSFNNIKIWNKPRLEECSDYLTSRKVYTVASGFNGSTFRIFLIGQEVRSVVKFLLEMSINTKSGRLSVTVKSNDPSAVPSLLQRLELNNLFDFRPSSNTLQGI